MKRKPLSNYHSLIYFEKADSYFVKFIVEFKNLARNGKALIQKCKSQRAITLTYISDINSGVFNIKYNSLKSLELIKYSITKEWKSWLFSPKEECEKIQINKRK